MHTIKVMFFSLGLMLAPIFAFDSIANQSINDTIYEPEINIADHSFISYELGSNNGSIIVDGRITYDDGLGLPFSREILNGSRIPLTGWVKDDGSHLYVSLDLSLSGIKSLNSDEATVLIKQPEGVKKYRLNVSNMDFGTRGKFEITQGKRSYEHRVFEFKIPLDGLSLKSGKIELAFTALQNSNG